MRIHPIHPLITAAAGLLLLSACGGGASFRGQLATDVYEIGLAAMADEDWNKAELAFESVLATPGFARGSEARLNLGRVLFAKKDFILARAEYQRVLDRYTADTTAPYASLGICESLAAESPRVERDQSSTAQAEVICAQVARDYAGTLIGLDAEEIRGEMYDKLAEKDYTRGRYYQRRNFLDSAIQYYEGLIEDRPRSKWVPWALYQLVEISEKIGYDDDAEAFRQRLMGEFADSEPAKLLRKGGAS
jgi:outer membrane assembly lipoprotein YfiO